MRLALGIVSMFPGGGLQRDCLAIRGHLRRRGHEVTLFAARVEPAFATEHAVTKLAVRAWSNHGLDRSFAHALAAATAGRFDAVAGFNKLPGLDLLYCADPCLRARETTRWHQMLPRTRTRLAFEAACFAPSSKTEVLLLTEAARDTYHRAWGTPAARLTVLPPSIAPERIRPELRTREVRLRVRHALGLGESDTVWLWIGTQPETKGLDRVLRALRGHHGTKLLAVGAPDAKAAPCRRLAGEIGVGGAVHWLGHRDDVPELMAAADLLVHPARTETTGQVILEALAVGLPVIASAACGFALHVAEADAGIVVPEPFAEDELASALARAADPAGRDVWSLRARRHVAGHDFTSGLRLAAEHIERAGLRGRGSA